VNHISNIFSSKDVGIAYIYCDYQDQTDQSPENLTSSLVKQLARKQGVMPPLLEELYKKFSRGGKRPNLKEITTLLLQLSSSFSKTYIIVDALDECESIVHRKKFLSVLQVLENAHIRLFITSRPHPPDIQRAFNSKPQLNIVATEQDIREYLASRLDDDYELADLISPDLRDDIVSNITSNVCGM
jgi:phosphoribosylpyrophosphate synthetase